MFNKIRNMKSIFIVLFFFTSLALFAQNQNAQRLRNFNTNNGIALREFDPISYLKGKPVKGTDKFKYDHKGITYYFANSANLEEFKKSPGKRVMVPMWMASDHFMVGWGRVETLSPTLLFVDTGLVGAGVKLAESVIKEAGIKLEESKASEGSGGGGTLKIVPYTVHQVSFGDMKEENVPGLYDGPFPWENTFGFHLAGMVGHDFFKSHAVTFDFTNMQIFLQ